jgi:hypothetical protein
MSATDLLPNKGKVTEFDDKVVFEPEIPGPSAPRGAPAASRYDPFGTLSLITGFVSSLQPTSYPIGER